MCKTSERIDKSKKEKEIKQQFKSNSLSFRQFIRPERQIFPVTHTQRQINTTRPFEHATYFAEQMSLDRVILSTLFSRFRREGLNLREATRQAFVNYNIIIRRMEQEKLQRQEQRQKRLQMAKVSVFLLALFLCICLFL